MIENNFMLIGAFAKKAGVSIRTVRYYQEKHLLPPDKRNDTHQRVFDDEDLHWMINLHYLREAGMSIVDLQHYTDLVRQGESSLPERVQILRQQRQTVEQAIRDKQQQLKVIDHKLSQYESGEDGYL